MQDVQLKTSQIYIREEEEMIMKKSKAVISLLTASAMTVGLMSTGTVAFAAVEESTSDLNVMPELPVRLRPSA